MIGWTGVINLKHETIVVSCKHGIATTGCMNLAEFLGWVKDY
jgi:hypothetical protein